MTPRFSHSLALALALPLVAAAAAVPAADAAKRRPAGMPPTAPPASTQRALAGTFAAPRMLVSISRAPAAEALLRRSRARLVSRHGRVWVAPGPTAAALVPRLLRLGALRYVLRDDAVIRERRARYAGSEPLAAQQWWLAAVGADRVSPPGPGIPIVVIDDGVDATHPEFAGRADTAYLNAQSLGPDDPHGTMVASVAAAPLNGVGIAGLYPTAALRAWDFGGGSCSEVVAGVASALAAQPLAVLNFSGGFTSESDCYPLYDAVAAAFGAGHLVVAAAGNEGESGSPETFPAAYPHVLTVAATTATDAPASFSSQALGLDLAAPGESIPAAVPAWYEASGFLPVDGTSFSAPLVSAAAAWAWTQRRGEVRDVTQLFELVRTSARDVGPAGWDADTGFGVLDLPALLTRAMPAADHSEPNDDVYQVAANGLFRAATPALLRAGARSAQARASVDLTEDPVDVYRISVPARRSVEVVLKPSSNVDLEIFHPRARTVYHANQAAAVRGGLLAGGYRAGNATERVRVRNPTGRAAVYYVCAYKPRGARMLDASYTITARRLP